MPRYKITIEYLGTNLCGWQRQDNAPSVQELLEKSIYSFSGESPTLHAAGRTDAGVHALAQVAHFDLLKEYDVFATARAINHFLMPNLVAVTNCEMVSDDFHARFSAKSRHYLYRINNRPGKVAIDSDRAWWLYKPLDIKSMEQAAKYLVGKHDFSSFRASECQSASPIKTLDKIEITRVGDEVHFSVSAKSFLHHMVRNIVGTLVMVGHGKWQPDDVLLALKAKKREAAGPTAPAYGLYFTRVDY
jgi:tRNA pseudouridine38-40 synthase